MADEGEGGEQIGRLWVEIGGNAKTLDDILVASENRLKDFIKTEYNAKIGVTFEESGGANKSLVDRTGRQIGTSIGQAALGNIESKPVRIKDVKIEAKPKVDKDTMVAAIQGALNGHKFQLTLDVEHLKTQIQSAFGNLSISPTGGHAAPPPRPVGITPEQRAEFDQRFANNKFSAVGGKSQSLGSVFENLARDIHQIVGGSFAGGGPTAAVEDLIGTLGEDISKWRESFAKLAPDEDITAARVENLAKKLTGGPLGQEIVAARQQTQQQAPRQDVNQNATFVAQAANMIAKAVHEEAPAPQAEATIRRRATLSDQTFVGKPFSSDLVAQFFSKYFTPELSRIGGSKNQPDFGALGNLAEYSENEAGTGRPSPTGRYIGFDPESKAPAVARLKSNKPLRFAEGEVRRKSVAEVITAAASRLRGQPADEFPDEVQARLAKIIEVAETANRNSATVKPGSSNRSGILSLSPSLQSYASQDVRLSEVNRIIERIQKGGGGAFAARRLGGLQAERERLVEGGAQSLRYPSKFDRDIARAADRVSSRRSRQAVEAGVGKTPGELSLEQRERDESDTAHQLAAPYSALIRKIPQELSGGGNTENAPTQTFVGQRFRAIRDEARDNFGGQLPRGVGKALAEELHAIRNLLDPKNGGTAVPSGGGKSSFTRGRSFADEDVQAAERGTPTGVVRPPLPTTRSLRIGELEAKLGQSGSEIARSQGGPRAGVDPQTQEFVRRSRQRAIEAAQQVGLDVLSKARSPQIDALEPTHGRELSPTGAKIVERIQASQENDKIVPKKGRAGERDRLLLAAREAFRATTPGANSDDEELKHLRTVRDSAKEFVTKNQGLGLQGVLDLAGSKRGAVRRLPKEVEDEIRDMLRIPTAGTGGKRSRSLEERGESGEPNSIARALGRDFIRDRNPVKSGDDLRGIHSKIAFTADGPTTPTQRETEAWLAGEGSLVGLAEKKNPGGAGFSGGTTGGGGGSTGGGFSFPIPLPVSIVQSIPLTIMAGAGGPRIAQDSGVASAADQAEAAVIGQQQAREQKPKRYRRKPLNARDIGTTADVGKVYTFDPEVYDEQDRKQEAKNARERELALQRLTQQQNRRPLSGANREIRASFQDLAEEDRARVDARLRDANRVIPRRGFTASLTDLVTSKLGGNQFSKQLIAQDRAAREASDLNTLGTQRANLRAEQRVLIRGGARPGDGSAQGQRLGEVRKELTALAPVIRRSTEIFNKNVAEVTKGTNVMRSFAAAGAGAAVSAAVGSITFGLGLAITGPLIQAIGEGFSQVAGSGIERLSGYSSTAAREQTALGQATRAAGGRAEVAFAQAQLQTGLGPTAAAQIEAPVTKRAQIEAGNQALVDQLDLFRASEKFRDQNAGTLGDAALSNNFTGALGTSIGGTPSAAETLSNLFQDVPAGLGGPKSPEDQAFLQQQRDIAAQENTVSQQALAANPNDVEQQHRSELAALNLKSLNDELAKATTNFDTSNSALDFFNAQTKDAGVNLKAIGGGKLSDTDRAAQVQALFEARLPQLAQRVQDRQVGFTNNEGGAITNPNQFVDLLTKFVTNTPKPSPQAFLDAQAPQLKADLFLQEKQRDLNLKTNRLSEGIDVGAQPFLPATSGIAFTKQDTGVAGMKSELAGAQKIFDQITKEAAAARSEAVDFFKAAFPGNASAATAFADSLGKSAEYGKEISDIQLGVETQQAALAAHQYSFQISQVKRSLQDALGLQGKITSGAQNLGVIERQQFELQRQSQALSLGQSQRQINFQRAIAGLTAPGLTGEERAARIEQAKLEADYAQKQLNIQKKLFGLGGRQFKVTADRNVQDLTRNLELLGEGRQVTLRTAVAQKQIQALTVLQARENKKIQTFYQSAVDATGKVLQLEAQLVAQTEVGLNKVGNLVLNQFEKVYNGLIHDLGGTTSSRQQEDTGPAHASGVLGMTRGTTNLGYAGEAGGEAVAIIKNPTPITGSFGGGGGTTQVVIDLRGANVSDEQMLNKLTTSIQQSVERGLAKKGALLGLR